MKNALAILLSVGVVGGALYLGRKASTPAPGTPTQPNALPAVPTTTTGPKLPPVKPLTGLTAAQSAVIATLLDTRVHADPVLLEQYAKIAGGADGKQNPGIVGQLFGKAFVMRQEARKVLGANPGAASFTSPT